MSPQRETSFLQPGLVFVFKIIRVQKSPIVFIVNFQDDFLFLVTTFSFFHFFYHFHFYCQWDAVHILTVLPSPHPTTHPPTPHEDKTSFFTVQYTQPIHAQTFYKLIFVLINAQTLSPIQPWWLSSLGCQLSFSTVEGINKCTKPKKFG